MLNVIFPTVEMVLLPRSKLARKTKVPLVQVDDDFRYANKNNAVSAPPTPALSYPLDDPLVAQLALARSVLLSA